MSKTFMVYFTDPTAYQYPSKRIATASENAQDQPSSGEIMNKYVYLPITHDAKSIPLMDKIRVCGILGKSQDNCCLLTVQKSNFKPIGCL